MTNLKNFLVLFGFVALAFASCKKDEETKTAAEYLTTGSWKLTAATGKIGSALEVSILDSFIACDKDDLMTYKAGGIFVFDAGAIKCNSSDPQTEEGTYSLSSDGKTLTIDGEAVSVQTLDGTTLKTQISEVIAGQPYVKTYTFSH